MRVEIQRTTLDYLYLQYILLTTEQVLPFAVAVTGCLPSDEIFT